MATTGEKYPTLGETISEAPWSDNTWTTPENTYADDAATANVTAASFDLNDQTYVLKATGFDFSVIPDGATIDGVICRVNSWYAAGSGSVDLMQLLDTSKAKVGTNQCATAEPLTTVDTTVITKGGATDLWGNALTSAWVKNANFGVALGILATANNADVFVDYVTLEIYYTSSVTAVGDTVQKVWNVRATLGDTNQYIYNIRQAVPDTSQSIWNVRFALGDTVQHIWHIRSAIGDTIQHIWHTRFALGKPVQFIHNILATIGDTVQTIWNVLTSLTAVGDTFQLVWHIRQAIGDTSQSIWNIRATIADTMQSVWNTLTSVADTVQSIWNVRNVVAQTRQALWNVRQALGDTIQAIWNVLGQLTTIGKAFQSLWYVGIRRLQVLAKVSLSQDLNFTSAITTLRSITSILGHPLKITSTITEK